MRWLYSSYSSLLMCFLLLILNLLLVLHILLNLLISFEVELDFIFKLFISSFVIIEIHLKNKFSSNHFGSVLIQLVVKGNVICFNSNLHQNLFWVSTRMWLHLAMVNLLQWYLGHLWHSIHTSKLRRGRRILICSLRYSLWFLYLKLFIYWYWSRFYPFIIRRYWTWRLLLVCVISIASCHLIFRVLVLLILSIWLFLLLRKLSFSTVWLLLLVLSWVNHFLTFPFSFNNLISHILRLYL